MSGVKVAVRVRPFNSRENTMNAKCCLEMEGKMTVIVDPETQKDKKFTFDFSYWSHDCFREGDDGELIATNPKYATQRAVYDDIGADVLNNAFGGYNSTLFAYGQTGAGKSFSMVGYGVNKGIIPIVCNEMFKQVTLRESDPNYKFQVVVTMLEIYNEVIRDLLNPASNVPGGLKIRSKPGIGVYVEDLSPVAVRNYDEIEAQMEQGTTNRTVASTKMNATSSRAHTVFGIVFTTLRHDPDTGADSEMAARMNLVDLAGSERAESTGATGDRLKEGCAINASLSALGNVISALADLAMGKKKVFVPYRNSALTRLLQDALGGNSKTIMIAALSPADVNYEETLGTLRYADRAKKIKNKVVKMENPTDKIIRLLKEENSKMKKLLESGGMDLSALDSAGGEGGDASEMKAKLEAEHQAKLEKTMTENNKIIEEMKKSWEQKLQDSAAFTTGGEDTGGAVSASSAKGTMLPRLVNLHEDPMLSECVVYMIREGKTIGGRGRPDSTVTEYNQIQLSGLSIKAQHVQIMKNGADVTIQAMDQSKTFVNGDHATEPTSLKNGDRVIIGNNFVFRYVDPNMPEVESKEKASEAWGNAMSEFQEKQGMRILSVSGEAGKLEAENMKERLAMEKKLKAMEDQLNQQRNNAKKALAEQQRRMQAGETLSEQDMANLLADEKQMEQKTMSMEEELTRKKKLTDQIIQEQMKRTRETKQIEAELSRVMPLVSEANTMADELTKDVRFECRLVVTSDETSLTDLDDAKALKTIEVQIRVTSQSNSASVWNWSLIKFDSRLFMMRELYQQYLDFGPQELTKTKDPFWDPPEPFTIGKAYVYLKALSHLVEIDSGFALVDYKGEENGTLNCAVYPEDKDGEELDYLESADDLLGKDVAFVVRISGVKDVPQKYSNDVFVSYSFNGEKHETQPCEGKDSNPNFRYEQRFVVENIDKSFISYLTAKAAVFEVKGFNDQGAQEKVEVATETDTIDVMDGSIIKCAQCEEQVADFYCVECETELCEHCFNLLHRSAKKAAHTKIPMSEMLQSSDSPSPDGVLCERCEEQSATVQCVECDMKLCDDCNSLLHKSKKKAGHTRIPLGGDEGEQRKAVEEDKPPICERCEEADAFVYCEDCGLKLCEECDELLHRSAKKKGHSRQPIVRSRNDILYPDRT